MLCEDLKAHEIRKIIVAKDCVTVIIPMALLRRGGVCFLKKTQSILQPQNQRIRRKLNNSSMKEIT